MLDAIESTSELKGTYDGTEIVVEAVIMAVGKKYKRLRLSLIVNGTVQDQQVCLLGSRLVLRGHRDREERLPITVRCESFPRLRQIPWDFPFRLAVQCLVTGFVEWFEGHKMYMVQCEIETPDRQSSKTKDITWDWAHEKEKEYAGLVIAEDLIKLLEEDMELRHGLTDEEWQDFITRVDKARQKTKEVASERTLGPEGKYNLFETLLYPKNSESTLSPPPYLFASDLNRLQGFDDLESIRDRLRTICISFQK